MQRNHLDETHELIELGSVSDDTKGGLGKHWEGFGYETTGLSAD